METKEIESLIYSQEKFFAEGHSENHSFRFAMLELLELVLLKHKSELLGALKSDLGKSEFEALSSEFIPLVHELRFVQSQLKKWMKNTKVKSDFFQVGAKSIIRSRPYGKVLCLSTWNYPLLLSLIPAINAISAGNTIILKPSDQAPHTSKVIYDMVSAYFTPEFFTVIEGGPETAKALLASKIDFVFYVGGGHIGKQIALNCIERNIPYSLELGGKNPAIALQEANIIESSRNIAWTKILNAGQTCIAVDELWVARDQRDSYIKSISEAMTEFLADRSDYVKIVNDKQFNRLEKLLGGLEIAFGGERDGQTRFFAPTIIVNPPFDHPISKEEIFGPILILRTYDDLIEPETEIEKRPWPLALYVYASDEKVALTYSERFRFGSGGINEAVLQYGNARLPLGGIGASGLGRLKGYAGFKNFSYEQSMVIGSKRFRLDRYPPKNNKFKDLFEKLARLKLPKKLR